MVVVCGGRRGTTRACLSGLLGVRAAGGGWWRDDAGVVVQRDSREGRLAVTATSWGRRLGSGCRTLVGNRIWALRRRRLARRQDSGTAVIALARWSMLLD